MTETERIEGRRVHEMSPENEASGIWIVCVL